MVRKINVLAIALVIFMTVVVFAKEGDLWQTVGNATVRNEPSVNSEVVSYLKQGVIVQELEQQGSWIKIKSVKTGKEGWVHKSLLAPVTKEQVTGCQGVQGFSAVCPVQKDVKVPQGVAIDTSSAQAGNTPEFNQAQTSFQQAARVGIPALPRNVPLPQSATLPEGAGKQAAGSVSAEKLISGDSADLQQSVSDAKDTLTGISYTVSPEKTTMVKMSSTDVNRIVCPVDIKDVVYSEEKGIQVKISGKNAFVKFLVKRLGTKETYSTIPADIYVVCGDKVYSIIALPERIPSVTVYLEDRESKIKEVLEKNAALPYERKIINYVREFSSGRVPPEAVYTATEKEYRLYQDLEIREKGSYRIEGEGLTVRVFHVVAKKAVEIREKDFLRKEITQNPLAISLDRLRLNQGDRAVLLIIEKTGG
ncbi:MAG: type-F conjugative transfer system secretin TraK [Candidatus Bathyarchaeia archaeon]